MILLWGTYQPVGGENHRASLSSRAKSGCASLTKAVRGFQLLADPHALGTLGSHLTFLTQFPSRAAGNLACRGLCACCGTGCSTRALSPWPPSSLAYLPGLGKEEGLCPSDGEAWGRLSCAGQWLVEPWTKTWRNGEERLSEEESAKSQRTEGGGVGGR